MTPKIQAPAPAPEPLGYLSEHTGPEGPFKWQFSKTSAGVYRDTALRIIPVYEPGAQAPAVKAEPVAFMWQHDETGRTGFVAADFDRAHWAEHNPRLKIVSPCYATPPDHVAVMRKALDALEWADNGFEEGTPINVSNTAAIKALQDALGDSDVPVQG